MEMYADGSSARSINVLAKFRLDKVPTGSSTTNIALVVRRIDVNNAVRAYLRFNQTFGTIASRFTKVVAGVGTSSPDVNTLLTHTANDSYWVRVEAIDDGTTLTVNMNTWKVGTGEPGGWQSAMAITDAALLASGTVGMRFEGGAATNAPLTLAWDSIEASSLLPTLSIFTRRKSHRRHALLMG
jgi:hypothetical protein